MSDSGSSGDHSPAGAAAGSTQAHVHKPPRASVHAFQPRYVRDLHSTPALARLVVDDTCMVALASVTAMLAMETVVGAKYLVQSRNARAVPEGLAKPFAAQSIKYQLARTAPKQAWAICGHHAMYRHLFPYNLHVRDAYMEYLLTRHKQLRSPSGRAQWPAPQGEIPSAHPFPDAVQPLASFAENAACGAVSFLPVAAYSRMGAGYMMAQAQSNLIGISLTLPEFIKEPMRFSRNSSFRLGVLSVAGCWGLFWGVYNLMKEDFKVATSTNWLRDKCLESYVQDHLATPTVSHGSPILQVGLSAETARAAASVFACGYFANSVRVMLEYGANEIIQMAWGLHHSQIQAIPSLRESLKLYKKTASPVYDMLSKQSVGDELQGQLSTLKERLQSRTTNPSLEKATAELQERAVKFAKARKETKTPGKPGTRSFASSARGRKVVRGGSHGSAAGASPSSGFSSFEPVKVTPATSKLPVRLEFYQESGGQVFSLRDTRRIWSEFYGGSLAHGMAHWGRQSLRNYPMHMRIGVLMAAFELASTWWDESGIASFVEEY